MEFRDLKAQYKKLHTKIDQAVHEVCLKGDFIGGKQVKQLEQELAAYVGTKHCITCANGTDAIVLALMAWNIGAMDAVFVPDFTFFASAEAPATLSATPIFVDVDAHTYNMSAEALEKAIEAVISEGRLRPKVIITVDLFGLPADYEKIKKIANKYHLLILEDGAQGFGGSINGKKSCSFGDISTTSFFPAKPLGCYGDGGAIFTNNSEWNATLRSLCVHGKGSSKYENIRIGMNSRLDTIQAAILNIKFEAFVSYELEAINTVAKKYSELLRDYVQIPAIPEGYMSSWAQYTICFKDTKSRNKVKETLALEGIPSMIYYEKPMHEQKAFEGMRFTELDYSTTRMLCNCVLSLPIHPYMETEDIHRVIKIIKQVA